MKARFWGTISPDLPLRAKTDDFPSRDLNNRSRRPVQIRTVGDILMKTFLIAILMFTGLVTFAPSAEARRYYGGGRYYHSPRYYSSGYRYYPRRTYYPRYYSRNYYRPYY